MFLTEAAAESNQSRTYFIFHPASYRCKSKKKITNIRFKTINSDSCKRQQTGGSSSFNYRSIRSHIHGETRRNWSERRSTAFCSAPTDCYSTPTGCGAPLLTRPLIGQRDILITPTTPIRYKMTSP